MQNIKKTIYYWLEDEDNPKLWISSTILIALVFASVILILIEETILHPSEHLHELNNVFILIFGLEYLARLYCIDLKYKSELTGNVKLSFIEQVKLRLKWMITPLALIDLISLIPNVRVFRLLRVLRAFKILRYMSSITVFLRGVKTGWVLYIVLTVVTFLIISFGSVAIFLAEHDATSADYDNYVHTLFHVLKIFGLVEITPKTILGKILSTGVLLYNMVFFGFIVSFVNQKMSKTMEEIKKGHLGKLNLKNHICILGYPKNMEYVIKDLIVNKLYMNKIVVLSENGGPDMHNVISVTGDFTDNKWLDYINIKDSETVIITAEKSNKLTDKDIDLRTILTLYKVNDIIEQNNSESHIIVELLDQRNSKLINHTKSKSVEIILKELIDALLINSSIHNHYSSFIFKKIISIRDEDLLEKSKTSKTTPLKSKKNYVNEKLTIVKLQELTNEKPKIIKDLRISILDKNIQIVGVMIKSSEDSKKPMIDVNPRNDKKIESNMEFIVYGEF